MYLYRLRKIWEAKNNSSRKYWPRKKLVSVVKLNPKSHKLLVFRLEVNIKLGTDNSSMVSWTRRDDKNLFFRWDKILRPVFSFSDNSNILYALSRSWKNFQFSWPANEILCEGFIVKFNLYERKAVGWDYGRVFWHLPHSEFRNRWYFRTLTINIEVYHFDIDSESTQRSRLKLLTDLIFELKVSMNLFFIPSWWSVFNYISQVRVFWTRKNIISSRVKIKKLWSPTFLNYWKEDSIRNYRLFIRD